MSDTIPRMSNQGRRGMARNESARYTIRASSRTSGDQQEKNPAAVELGRLGGVKGGRIRAERLSPERRSEIIQSHDLLRRK